MEQLINTVTFGDCISIFTQIPNNVIDLIATDPPYGVEFDGGYDDSKAHVFASMDQWLEEIARVLKPSCHCYLFVPTIEIDHWIAAVRKYLSFNNVLATQCYVTNNQASIKNNFTFDFQPVIFASKGKAKDFNKVDWIPTSGAWLRDKRNKNPKPFTYMYPSYIYHDLYRSNVKPNAQIKLSHPNEKNPAFIEQLIRISSNEGDIVCDPFAGSGSTAIAAWNANRKFITMESNAAYYEKTKKRIQQHMLQTFH